MIKPIFACAAAVFAILAFSSPSLAYREYKVTVQSYSGPTVGKKFGLGVALGSPTAITGKYFMNPVRAFDVGVGYWFGSYIEVYSDYLWHFPMAFAGTRDPGPQFVPYLGLGGDFHVASSPPPVNDNNHPYLGFYVRIPLGMEWFPGRAPFGIFLEFVPAIQIIPGVSGAFGAAIGARFYF